MKIITDIVLSFVFIIAVALTSCSPQPETPITNNDQPTNSNPAFQPTTNKFVSADCTGEEQLGGCCAISADQHTIVAGAFYENDFGDFSGAAYCFKWNGGSWTSNKLIAFDGAEFDSFGSSVAVSEDGNIIAVGCPGDDDLFSDCGSVYLFKWNGISWTTNKIIAVDAFAGAAFGTSVSLSADGNTIAIGARGYKPFMMSTGCAYVFKYNGSNWTTNQFLDFSDVGGENFGYSIAISPDGNTFVVGSYGDQDNGLSSGSIHRYHWNGLTWETNKIIPGDGAAYDCFGYSVAISADGNTIAVGANQDDDVADEAGSVYRFQWNSTVWLTNKFVAYNGTNQDGLGFSISLSADGNTIAAGALHYNDTGIDSGGVYVFHWNGINWQTNIITPFDRAESDGFGSSVSMVSNGNSLLAGAPGNDGIATNAGAVYLYQW